LSCFILFILFINIILSYFLNAFILANKFILFILLIYLIGDWGLGIGDWGLGIGDWAQSPIPKHIVFYDSIN